VAVSDNRGIDLVAPEHLKSLTLGVVIDAGEPGANERASVCHALDEPVSRAHLDEITGRRNRHASSGLLWSQKLEHRQRSKDCSLYSAVTLEEKSAELLSARLVAVPVQPP
jgi:hypothetical protein